MPLTNPFSPLFGGRPDLFFGRSGILGDFDLALVDPASECRALFLTGPRGSGKTALVEQLSRRAVGAGWAVFDLGPDQPALTLVRSIAGYDERVRTSAPQVGVNILGSGASVGGISSSKVTRIGEADLTREFVSLCARQDKGVLVTVDEAQKLSEQDASLICNAFQMATRKGHDAILVLAGLPGAHTKIIGYEGCTFMRRASHRELSLLTKDEAREALGEAFRRNPNLTMEAEATDELVRASFGHPYMVQLLGYYLLVVAGDRCVRSLGIAEAGEARRLALAAYESRALRPMLLELAPSKLEYLRALASALDEGRVGRTADVAKLMGKTTNQTGYLRDALLGDGLVVSAGRGELMFTIPYLASYLLKEDAPSGVAALIRSWGV